MKDQIFILNKNQSLTELNKQECVRKNSQELDFLKNKSEEIGGFFNNVSKSKVIGSLSHVIDLSELNDDFADKVDITKGNHFFAKTIQKLQEYEDYPALYFFSINPEIEYSAIFSLIQGVKTRFNKVIPVFNSIKRNTGILYIGKVKGKAWGRYIQHLGYHKNKKSHGLHIGSWAKQSNIELNIKYTIIFFEKEMKNYIQILEKEFANDLKPLIGKH